MGHERNLSMRPYIMNSSVAQTTRVFYKNYSELYCIIGLHAITKTRSEALGRPSMKFS